MSRRISEVPAHVYFVIDSKYNYTYGPYSTKSAAKGKRTTEIGVGYYNREPKDFTIVESPCGQWTEVTL